MHGIFFKEFFLVPDFLSTEELFLNKLMIYKIHEIVCQWIPQIKELQRPLSARHVATKGRWGSLLQMTYFGDAITVVMDILLHTVTK